MGGVETPLTRAMWISVSQGIQFIPSLMVNVNKVQVMQKVSELCKVAVQSSGTAATMCWLESPLCWLEPHTLR